MDGKARVQIWLELKAKEFRAGWDKAKQYVGTKVSEMKAKISELKTSHIDAFKSMGNSIPGFGSAMELLGNPYALAAAGVIALGTAYFNAGKMAAEFDERMRKANATAQESEAQFAQTKKEVLAIAGRSQTKDADVVAPTAYNILLSAGLDKKTALDTLEPTLNAAKAGFTDVEIVARAAAASMNSSGVKDATRLYDILFATLNKGNAEFSDIAQYLPKIIPSAKNVGLNLEQVAGAFAYLTAQGQTSERAATLLENSFKILGDPEKAKLFKKIGVEFYDMQGGLRPLASIMQDTAGALTGLTDKQKAYVLSTLGLDMEAAGAFSAMAQDAGTLKQTIDFITNSQGQFQKTVEATTGPLDSWNQITNAIRTGWDDLGDKINKTQGDLGNWLLPIVQEYMPKLVDLLAGVFDIIITIIKPAINLSKIFIDWVTKSELLVDIGKLIGLTFEFIGKVIEKVGDVITWIYEHTLKPIFDIIDGIYTAGKKMLGLKTNDNANGASLKQTEETYKAGQYIGFNQAMSLNQQLFDKNKPTPDFGDKKNLYKPAEPSAQVRKILGAEGKKDKNGSSSGSTASSNGPRQVTINKVVMIDGNFISNNPEVASMNKKELERFMEGIFERFIISLGRSYE